MFLNGGKCPTTPKTVEGVGNWPVTINVINIYIIYKYNTT